MTEGTVRARGRDLGRLSRELGDVVKAAIARVAPELERHGATSNDR